MKKIHILIVLVTISLVFAGCSVFGQSGVEIAPYSVIEEEGQYSIRHYEKLVLVSTSMSRLSESRSPFSKLFNYISGNNDDEQKIAMTAPVFMDQKDSESDTMAFVLPVDMDFKEAPIPLDPDVRLQEITDYTVAVITFNGSLHQDNIQQHKTLLESWVAEKGLNPIGSIKAAGYNPPFTLPALRRNEVLIQIEKPQVSVSKI